MLVHVRTSQPANAAEATPAIVTRGIQISEAFSNPRHDIVHSTAVRIVAQVTIALQKLIWSMIMNHLQGQKHIGFGPNNELHCAFFLLAINKSVLQHKRGKVQ